LGVALTIPAYTDISSKKRKRKKRKKKCKKTYNSCSGSKKCCSKRCCSVFEGSGRFCGPKGSTCCPDGGACPSSSPICCDPDIVPGCTTTAYPTCCPANDIVPEPYTCAVGYDCCDEEPGCCQNGVAATMDATPRSGLTAHIAGR
jgi:hypothetical protein